MTWVYLLRSDRDPHRTYVGLTDDVPSRLEAHNTGRDGSNHFTSAWRPWRLVATIGFEDPARASAFERYLKSGSGHAFARRHLC